MVNSWEVDERWAAPEPIEEVRRLLNTAERPAPESAADRLVLLAGSARSWRSLFPFAPLPERGELEDLLALRSDLLQALEIATEAAEGLRPWLAAHPVVVEIVDSPDGPVLGYAGDRRSVCGYFVAQVVEAIEDGTWRRLRSCPDCGLVFFDRSRNRSRRWCGMYAGESGRSCGSIAKVRAWRERQSAVEAD